MLFVGSMWIVFFVSIAIHEIGHLAGFKIFSNDNNWNISIGF